MFKNLLLYCENKKINVFDFVPITFLIEVDSQNYANEIEKFCSYFTFSDKLLSSKSIQILQLDRDLKESVLA
jgi:hypothetical protein